MRSQREQSKGRADTWQPIFGKYLCLWVEVEIGAGKGAERRYWEAEQENVAYKEVILE